MNLLYMMNSIPINFGIEGILISTIKHYPSSKIWLNEYHNYNLHMKEFAKDVLLVIMSRNHSQETIIDLRKL